MDSTTTNNKFPLHTHSKQSPFPLSMLKVTENDDLLTSILILLPTKSVTRFKTVSKHWLSLVSRQSFSLLHTNLSPTRPPSSIIFPQTNNNSIIHYISLNKNINTCNPSTYLSFTNDPSGEIEVVQSCNGLLLCSSGTSWDGINTMIYYIYNPTTKKFNTLPPPPEPNTTARHLSLSIFTKTSLAFDPSTSPYYKVVLVRKADGRTNFYRGDVYCSKKRGWKGCGDYVEWPSFEVFCNGVYVNGAVHWASKCDGFVRFDVEKECFQIMSVLPEFRTGGGTIRYFGESSGRLYLVDARVLEFDVFEIGKDYLDWVLKFRVDLGRVFGMYPCFFSQPQCDFGVEKTNISLVSVVGEGGDEGDLCLVLHVPGKILSYNLKNEGVKVMKDGFLGNVERIIPALIKGFGGYQHFESLACV